jgi:hypothetical protein
VKDVRQIKASTLLLSFISIGSMQHLKGKAVILHSMKYLEKLEIEPLVTSTTALSLNIYD